MKWQPYITGRTFDSRVSPSYHNIINYFLVGNYITITMFTVLSYTLYCEICMSAAGPIPGIIDMVIAIHIMLLCHTCI